MPTRRLFYALWPDDEVRHALLHWQTANLDAGVRWQHRDDLHMTLHFLGQVGAPSIEDLRRLGDACRVAPFTLVLDRIGHWSRPRVLWAAPTSTPGALRELQQDLGTALQAAGFTVDDRAYRPHVTLARKIDDTDGLRPLEPLTWRVDTLALVESRPGSLPLYRPLARWQMA